MSGWFQFIGDRNDNHNPNRITAYGYRFTCNGAPVFVGDEKLQAKFRGNGHFRELKEAPTGVLDNAVSITATSAPNTEAPDGGVANDSGLQHLVDEVTADGEHHDSGAGDEGVTLIGRGRRKRGAGE